MTPDEIAELLGLEPLPHEGGRWTSTWRDEHGSAIYFLMVPGDFSAMHRLHATELWHHYAGAPAAMLLLGTGADGTAVERPTLGTDLAGDQRPFVPVPAGVWMGARTLGDWSLVGTTMAPPYTDEGFELGDRTALAAWFPTAAADLEAFTRTSPP